MTKFKGRNIVSIDEFTRDEMSYLMRKSAEIAGALAQGKTSGYRFFEGADTMVASLFFENSTRTRGSFERAIKHLGASVDGIAGPEGSSVMKGESLRHTLEMFAAYGARAIIQRHPLDGSARWGAKVLQKWQIPLLNAGDGKHEHVTQTIMDRFSALKATGRLTEDCVHPYSLRGLTILMANDLVFGRVPHSAVKDMSHDGVHFIFVAPELFQMPPTYLKMIKERGSTYELYDRLDEDVLSQAELVMMFRPQKERFSVKALAMLERLKKEFILTPKKVEAMKPSARIMHPMPIPKWDPEIDPAVDDMDRAFYIQQAASGVPTRIATLALVLGCIGEDFEGELYQPPQAEPRFWTERSPTHKGEEERNTDDYHLEPVANGVVIDHLHPGVEYDVLGQLKEIIGSYNYRIGTVPKRSDRNINKGMVLIEDRELSDKEMKMVAAIAGGLGVCDEPVTINHVRNKQVVRKLDLELPPTIEGLGTCPNIVHGADGNPKGGCITRKEFYEHVPSRFVRAGNGTLRCWYCDHLMDSQDIFR